MKFRILFAFLIVLSAAACSGTFEFGMEHATAVPTGTPVPAAAATQTSVPTLKAPGDTPAPADAPLVHAVKIFLIAVGDGGQGGQAVGCGDSVIPVQVEITPTQGVLKAALESLLSVKGQYYGESGLYNALYQSDLKLESLKLDSGRASVYLTGTLTLGGECDNPRLQAQLEQTVLQFPTVTEADIFINGHPLADVLSLR